MNNKDTKNFHPLLITGIAVLGVAAITFASLFTWKMVTNNGGSTPTETECIVTFESNGGDHVDTKKVKAGSTITAPTITKTDYTFGGWYEKSDLSGDPFNFDTAINKDYTFFAKWDGGPEPTDSVAVSFVTNCNTKIDPVVVTKGGKINPPEISYANHSLVNWYTDELFTDTFDFDNTIESNITLYAYWLEGDISEPLTFTCKAANGEICIQHNIWFTETPRTHNLDLHYQIVDPDGTEHEWEKYPEIVSEPKTMFNEYVECDELKELTEGTKVRFAGDNDIFSHYIGASNDSETFSFAAQSSDVDFAVSGNVMSLLSRDNFAHLDEVPPGCFYKLFSSTNASKKTITDASQLLLPATRLGSYSYAQMFNWQANLKKGPTILPSLDLSQSYRCYSQMFYDSGVLSAPSLPATILGEECYVQMFEGSSVQVAIIDAPIEGFATNSCSQMFNSCAYLKHVEVAFGINNDEWPGGYDPDNKTSGWFTDVTNAGQFIWRGDANSMIDRSDSTVPADWTILHKN